MWWWRSYYRGASIGLYVLLYSSEAAGRRWPACLHLPPPRVATEAAGPSVTAQLLRAALRHAGAQSPPPLPLPLRPRPAVGFLVNTLNNLTGFLPIVLYVCYMGLMVWCLSLVMGTVGFLSSFIFTYKVRARAGAVHARESAWEGGREGWGGRRSGASVRAAGPWRGCLAWYPVLHVGQPQMRGRRESRASAQP